MTVTAICGLALAFAKAFKRCKEAKAAVTAVLLDNIREITGRPEMVRKLGELPFLVSYQFNAYKTVPVENGMEAAVFVTEAAGVGALLEEAQNVAESTMLARDLVNHPSKYMTPERLAEEAAGIAGELGIEVQVFHKEQIEELKMGAFLAVQRRYIPFKF